MDTKRFWLISTAVLSATLIFVGYFIKTPYKQQIASQQGITNTVSVSGEGRSSASPDTLLININVSELGKTTKEAQDKANTKIKQIKDSLQEFDIPEKNIHTTNLNIMTEYNWTNNSRKLLWYRSEQQVNIKVQWDNFAIKWWEVINKISEIGGIWINNVQFTINDTSNVKKEAREKAFADAKAKAQQLAKLGGLSLGKPTMITESDIQYFYERPVYANAKEMLMMDTGMWWADESNLSPGEMELSTIINIVYELK